MAKGYWIGRVTVTDPERYRGYMQANGEPIANYGGRFLVRGGQFRLGEGEARERNVVVEFPSYEAALACWDDPLYRAARAEREGAEIADVVIIEGYEA